ncbi:hypothetical protein OE88DRAFT_1028913 [Heliocybe sulcata]|uniref:Uncharacterized protein n=1 Tax=Heliocybe sulcata TaxID=5364 RepID=A0A5C3NC75_9AGAM|nr:hypothetical protein OE88DRAFT_1028913 [Heliocybe sulcata]
MPSLLASPAEPLQCHHALVPVAAGPLSFGIMLSGSSARAAGLLEFDVGATKRSHQVRRLSEQGVPVEPVDLCRLGGSDASDFELVARNVVLSPSDIQRQVGTTVSCARVRDQPSGFPIWKCHQIIAHELCVYSMNRTHRF